MGRQRYFHVLFFFTVIASFALYEKTAMLSVAYYKLGLDSGDTTVIRYALFISILCGGFCLFYPKPRFFISDIFSALVVCVWGVSMLHYAGNFYGLIAFSATALLPLIIMFYFYYVAQTIENSLFYTAIFFASVVIFQGFLISYQVQILYATVDTLHISSLYIYLFLLPLFLLSKSRLLRLCSIIFVAVCMLVSLKRGGAISFVVAILSYYIVSLYCSESKRKLANFFFIVSLITLSYLIITLGIQDYFEELLLRLENISEDEGSGRLPVYEVTWTMITKSDWLYLWIGHGWNMVVEDSPLALSAHNDFLEIIYDFGLVAFFLYVYFIYKLCGSMLWLIRRRSNNAAPFTFSVVTFLLNSTIAHILIYPFYFIAIAAVWGYIFGKEEYNKFKFYNNENRCTDISLCS